MRKAKEPIPVKKREQLCKAHKAKGMTARLLAYESGLSYPTVRDLLNYGSGSDAVLEAVEKAIHDYKPKKVKA